MQQTSQLFVLALHKKRLCLVPTTSLFDLWGDEASVVKYACLPAEYSQGLILPQRGSKQAPVQQKMVGVRTKRENSLPTSTSVSPASKPSGKGYMSVSSLVLRLLCEPRNEHGRGGSG